MHLICKVFNGSGKFCRVAFYLIGARFIDISNLINCDRRFFLNLITFADNRLLSINVILYFRVQERSIVA
jgi:hypothetical protein